MSTACAFRQLAALRQYLEERGGRAEKLEGWSVKTEAFYGPFSDQLMRNDSQVTTREPSCGSIQPVLERPDQPISMDHHHGPPGEHIPVLLFVVSNNQTPSMKLVRHGKIM